MAAGRSQSTTIEIALGRVDELDQDKSDCEGDEGGEVRLGLFAAQGDALEALELAHSLLDPGAASVERAREVPGGRGGVGLLRDHRNGTAGAGGGPVGAAVIALVGDHGAGRAIRAEVEQGLEHRRVGLLAAGDLEGDRVAVEVGLQVDLGRVSAP